MLVLRHANVITLDPAMPRATAVLVQGNRIQAVGGEDLLSGVQTRGAEVIDCRGKTVVPGFHDAHCHVLAFAASLLSVDCSPESARSIEDIKSALRRRAASTPPGRWVTGTGYNEFYLAEKRHPNRRDLDHAVPDRPVKLNHRSGHCCVLNSAGLSAVGIDACTPEPPGGVIEREPDTGEPSGLLMEMSYLVDRAIPPPSAAERAEALRLTGREYLSLGITSLQDATADNDVGRWRGWRRIKAQGLLSPRLVMMAGAEAVEELVLESGCSVEGNELRLGPAKIMVTGSTGELFPSPEELEQLVRRAHRAGLPAALHAIEESTVEAAVTALEKAGAGTRFRDRIEHCAECPPHLLSRLKRMSTVIVTQPPFVYYSGERYLAEVALSQQPWLYRIGSFMRQGLVVAGSSDSPVVPLNPLVGIYAAVTRRARSGQVLLAEERVAPLEALAMYTVNAAYSCSMEKDLGTIAPGKLAGLAVLSADPTAVPVEDIKDIKVEMTVLGGEVVWQA